MNNYTKEYIELCKDKRVQGLRNFRCGDWFYNEIGNYFLLESEHHSCNERDIWLPQSHNLDEEIIKICEKKQIYYYISYSFGRDDYGLCSVEYGNAETIISDTNPLIAKIKLLKELIKE